MQDPELKKYEDMLQLPHHQSGTHPRMSRRDRAAQFAPFSALTGHEEAIAEEERLTKSRVLLDEQALQILNEKFSLIREHLGAEQPVTFTCFVPDERKAGGAYRTCTGWVKKIDACARTLTLADGEILEIRYIVDMESELFKDITFEE